jgi:hypothetical protein
MYNMEWVENIDMMPESQKFGVKKCCRGVHLLCSSLLKCVCDNEYAQELLGTIPINQSAPKLSRKTETELSHAAKRKATDSQSCERVKYGHELCGSWNQD